MANVTVTLSGDGSKLAEQLNKLIALEKGLGNEADNAGKKSKRGTDHATAGLDKMASSIKSVAAGVVGGLGLTNAFQSGINMLKEYDSRLGQIAQKQEAVAKAAIPLGVLQPKGMEESAAKRAAELGTQYGVLPAESVDVVQELQSVAKESLEGGLALAEEAFKLSKLGVEIADAKRVLSYGHELGMTPQEASSLIFRGGELSRFTTGDFAKAMPSLMEYSASPEFGVAALSAISRNVEPEKLEVYTRQAALGLTTENEMTKKLHLDKKVEDLQKLGEEQGVSVDPFLARLMLVKQSVAPDARTGRYDIATMQKAGLTEEREARGVAILLNEFDRLVGELEDLKGRDVGAVQEKLAGIEQIPFFKAVLDEERHKAKLQYEQTWGKFSEDAREREAGLRKTADELEYSPWFVDQETGKPTWTGRFVAEIQRVLNAEGVPEPTPNRQPSSGPMSPVIPEDWKGMENLLRETLFRSNPTRVTQEEKMAFQWFGGNDAVAALEENTTATRELAAVLRDSKPQQPRAVPRANPTSGIE